MKHFVPAGRAELCVSDTPGPRTPVVCLHAGVCDQRMWAPQIDAWRGTRRTIAYDRRGFGETRYTAEAHSRVDDLMAVIDDAGLAQAVVMGCSQGGRIAIDAALAHPERVSALVLVACSVSGAPDDASGPFAPVIQARIEAFEAAEARGDQRAMNEIKAQIWLDGPAQPTGRIGGDVRALFLAMNGIALSAPDVGEVIEPPPAWPRLGDIRVPVLLVWGTVDFPHYGPRMREIERRITGAQSVVIDGAAHLPGLEQPEVFNRVVAAFLDALPNPPAPAPRP